MALIAAQGAALKLKHMKPFMDCHFSRLDVCVQVTLLLNTIGDGVSSIVFKEYNRSLCMYSVDRILSFNRLCKAVSGFEC